jgi:hypothetical protein
LAESTGAVLGVYSLQRGNSCLAPGVRNQLVHVPPFHSLIDAAFAAAGCEPLLETTSGAGGAEDGGGAGDATGAGADNDDPESSPTSGGAAGEAEPDPVVRRHPTDGAGCSVASAQGGAPAAGALAWLGFGVLARRRRFARPRHARRR